MQTDTYNTIKLPSEGLFKDKGSKFLSFAYPIRSEDEVKPIVQELKKQHHNARHHCFAYRLGYVGESYRANDDGEPSGTAGRPILGQLLSHNITNVLIVVVRYFGGTLLGVSGLINAYKNAANDAIINAQIEEKIEVVFYKLFFDYHLQNMMNKTIKDFGIELANSSFSTNCCYTIAIRQNDCEQALAALGKLDGLQVERL